MSRRSRPPWWATTVRRALALSLWLGLGLPLVAASCSSGSGSGSGSGSADATLRSAGVSVGKQMTAYLATAQKCRGTARPVVCLEAADRRLGGQVHTYANVLATGKGFRAPARLLAGARNNAQTLANSLEILGDAEPTQANYDQVRNTFDVNGALDQLRSAVASLDHALGS